MRCIFCKSISDSSVSEEHIIPESLGNVDHVLPPGWVCDTCNNYIARKIEKPFLESHYGKLSRATRRVPNKKGRIPPWTGFHPRSRTKIEMFQEDGVWCVAPAEGEDQSSWVKSVTSHESGRLWMLDPGLPKADQVAARFVAKVGLEALAAKCLQIPGWNDELVDKAEFDELRNFVRIGAPNTSWPISVRQIYPPDFLFADIRYGSHEILHEFMIHCIENSEGMELYAVVAIFGVEFAINLGGPELDGYEAWLKQNGNRSPLLGASPS